MRWKSGVPARRCAVSARRTSRRRVFFLWDVVTHLIDDLQLRACLCFKAPGAGQAGFRASRRGVAWHVQKRRTAGRRNKSFLLYTIGLSGRLCLKNNSRELATVGGAFLGGHNVHLDTYLHVGVAVCFVESHCRDVLTPTVGVSNLRSFSSFVHSFICTTRESPSSARNSPPTSPQHPRPFHPSL